MCRCSIVVSVCRINPRDHVNQCPSSRAALRPLDDSKRNFSAFRLSLLAVAVPLARRCSIVDSRRLSNQSEGACHSEYEVESGSSPFERLHAQFFRFSSIALSGRRWRVDARLSTVSDCRINPRDHVNQRPASRASLRPLDDTKRIFPRFVYRFARSPLARHARLPSVGDCRINPREHVIQSTKSRAAPHPLNDSMRSFSAFRLSIWAVAVGASNLDCRQSAVVESIRESMSFSIGRQERLFSLGRF